MVNVTFFLQHSKIKEEIRMKKAGFLCNISLLCFNAIHVTLLKLQVYLLHGNRMREIPRCAADLLLSQ